MIRSLRRRADRAGLVGRIEYRICQSDSLGIEDLEGKIDFALAFAVLHEMPDAASALSGVYASLKPGGIFLLAEPTGHVGVEAFEKTVEIAIKSGFLLVKTPLIKRSRSALLRK